VDHETFGGETHLECRLRRRLRQGHAHHAFGWQGVPRPRQHRPLRLRWQSGPETGNLPSRSSSRCGRRSARASRPWISAFDNHIDELIDYVFDPVTFDGRNENVERARIKGVELGYQFTGEAWRARAELTLQDPRNETTGERLLRRSREALVLAVSRDVGPLDLGIDLQAYGNRKDVSFPDNVTLDSYALFNATVRYRINGRLTLQGRSKTHSTRTTRSCRDIAPRGRTYTIGVRYSFD
jgi:outer membrane cobalamin receptor